jgi:hypothetical protein
MKQKGLTDLTASTSSNPKMAYPLASTSTVAWVARRVSMRSSSREDDGPAAEDAPGAWSREDEAEGEEEEKELK